MKPKTQSTAIVRCMRDIKERKPGWLWEYRFPLGKATLAAGDPGLGKSASALDIAARVTTGRSWPDGKRNGQPGSVVILSSEDDAEDTIKPRLRAMGADISKVHIIDGVIRTDGRGEVEPGLFNLEEDIEALQEVIVRLTDVRLVIFDPLDAYVGNTETHVNAAVRVLLAPLIALAQQMQFSILMLSHLNKKDFAPALYRASGSLAFVAVARAVWYFAKNPEDENEYLMLPVKCNLAPPQKGLSYRLVEKRGIVTVAWGAAINRSIDDVLAAQQQGDDEPTAKMEAVEWLKVQLQDGPVESQALKKKAREEGLAWRTVQRAKKTLGASAMKDDFQGTWSWVLPKEATSATEEKLTPFGKLAPFGETTDTKSAKNNEERQDTLSREVASFGTPKGARGVSILPKRASLLPEDAAELDYLGRPLSPLQERMLREIPPAPPINGEWERPSHVQVWPKPPAAKLMD